MNYQYDYLIVGSGLFGSVFSHQMSISGYNCLVIEKMDHIGGNCWAENIEGINCHKYGPHTFHTEKENLWRYVNSITPFYPSTYRTKSKIEDNVYSFPINLMTLHQVFGVYTPEEAKEKIKKVQEECGEITNLESLVKSQVGSLLYEMFFKGYTEKQWGRSPDKIPALVGKRIPIRYSFDDNYFTGKYQGIPVLGYQEFFKNLLKNVTVLCNTDYFSNREYWSKLARKTIFTGKIDEFYNYQFGDLEYRTLKFIIKKYPVKDFQGCPIMNYPSIQVPYTRSVEYKHIHDTFDPDYTIVIYEYPLEATRDDIAYYPINDPANNEKYQKYLELSLLDKDIIFGGRIGTYSYNDMDKTIENALKLVSEEKSHN